MLRPSRRNDTVAAQLSAEAAARQPAFVTGLACAWSRHRCLAEGVESPPARHRVSLLPRPARHKISPVRPLSGAAETEVLEHAGHLEAGGFQQGGDLRERVA